MDAKQAEDKIPIIMQNRSQHRQEVLTFLQNHFAGRRWELTTPSSGRGHETYIAVSGSDTYFIKLGAQVPYYEVMASLDLTPAVVTTGHLTDGTTIMVQPYVGGRNPSWSDFRHYLEPIAAVVYKTHHSPALINILPEVISERVSEQYKDAGLAAIKRVQQKWEVYRPPAPAEASYVDETLAQLKREVGTFIGSGLVVSHNDICNANWLIAADGRIYLVDLEAMSQDDPAHDLGSLLWWYYPPELRQRFLDIAGQPYGETFRIRMRGRMALHCLDIILPRAGSFDRFDAGSFAENLTDFRAVVAGEENPHGYGD